MRNCKAVYILLTVGVLAGVAFGPQPQTQPAPTTRKERKVFKKSALEREEVPITHPRGYEPKPPKPDLPGPGTMVINRLCRLERYTGTDWILLTFPPEAGREKIKPRWALPCRLLQRLEEIVEDKPQTTFRISGETTVYQDKPFCLLTKATVVAPDKYPSEKTPATVPAAETRPAPTTKPATRPATMPATTQATEDTTATTRPDETSPEDIAEELLKERPGKPVLIERKDNRPQEETPSVAPKPDQPLIETDRPELVVDRLVTVDRAGEGRWLEVNFVGDNTLREPPLKLLPCKLLHRAEAIADQPLQTVTLRVSGKITKYKGRRYLLLRKVIRVRDMGQF